MSTTLEQSTRQLLTHSRQDCFKTCRRKALFAYELGIRRDTDSKALRMGSAFHAALEQLGHGKSIDDSLEAVHDAYGITPDMVPQEEWDIERETVVRIACGYAWRWQDSGIEYLAAEQSFELPLINLETGKATPIWNIAGKIDGIIKLHDGRLAVLETKLLGDDIGPDSFLWRRMRRDHQVSIYVNAARRLGYPVDAVLYNVARKPTIKPTSVPELDDQKQKIVLDERGERVYNNNGSPKQTASTEFGWVVQSRPMTAEEWGDKLNEDIAVRPEFYFHRQEIARMDDDLIECDRELWDIQRDIRNAQKENRWFRTVNRNTCEFCAYDAICDRKDIGPGSILPEGFNFVSDVNPELS